MSEIQEQIAQINFEAEIRNPTYINFIDNMEYETEVERIINDSYNNLFDKYEQKYLIREKIMNFKRNCLEYKRFY